MPTQLTQPTMLNILVCFVITTPCVNAQSPSGMHLVAPTSQSENDSRGHDQNISPATDRPIAARVNRTARLQVLPGSHIEQAPVAADFLTEAGQNPVSEFSTLSSRHAVITESPFLQDLATQQDEQDKESLAPLQSRDLSVRVQTVNTSMDGIGTGLLPESAFAQRKIEVRPLPTGQTRGASYKPVSWQSAQICHFPLYFEDAMLERHGHVRFGHLQSLAGGVRFFSTFPILPYLKVLRPTCQPVYAFGHYRAGSCAPLLKDHLPYDKRAAATEALSLGAFFWAAPL